MAFSDIIGQQELVDRLKTAVCGVPGHAYAFLGPQGSGRRLLARAFAKALLCNSTNDGESCNQCASCRYFDNGVHPDYTFVAREGKDKNIKVERVRHAITADVAMKPQMARHKVYLIMADDLNEPGQNALLKSLEEPPPYAVFILIAAGMERLLPTVRSRVVPLMLARLSENEIVSVIRQTPGSDKLDIEELRFYARYAAGVPGSALNLLAEEWFAPLRQETADFYFSLSRANPAVLLTEGYTFFETNKPHIEDMLTILESFVRDEMTQLTTSNPDWIINRDFIGRFQAGRGTKAAGRQEIPLRQKVTSLANVSQAIHQTRKALSYNVSFEISVCQLLIVLRRELLHA